MALVSSPSGFLPAYHPTGNMRSVAHTGILMPGTNVNIFKGQPVKLVIGTGGAVNGVTVPAGQVVLAPITLITDPVYGIFAGVEYFDATGFPQESNFWPASQVCFPATAVTAFIWQDPLIEYSVQADAAIVVATTLGDAFSRFDGREGTINTATVGNGSPQVGLSQATFLGGVGNLVATGVQGQFQITKLDPSVLNQTPADGFPQLQVRIARPQTAAPFVSI